MEIISYTQSIPHFVGIELQLKSNPLCNRDTKHYIITIQLASYNTRITLKIRQFISLSTFIIFLLQNDLSQNVTFHSAFLLSVRRKTWIKTPSYIIKGLHPSPFYQLQALALASLQAIRARELSASFLSSSPPSLLSSSLSLTAWSLVVGLGSVGSWVQAADI